MQGLWIVTVTKRNGERSTETLARNRSPVDGEEIEVHMRDSVVRVQVKMIAGGLSYIPGPDGSRTWRFAAEEIA